MRIPSHRVAIALVLFTVLFTTTFASIAQAQVKDPAGTFSPQAVRQAEALMEQIRQQSGAEFLVEVFPTIPVELQDQYQPQNRVQFFEQWATRRANELKVNGVYVLVSRQPGHVRTILSGEARQKFNLTDQDRGRISSTILDNFRQNKFDEGLLAATKLVQQRLTSSNAAAGTANQKQSQGPIYGGQPPGANRPASRGLPWIWIILGGLALFLIIRMMRRRHAMAHAGVPGGGHYDPRTGRYIGNPNDPNQRGYPGQGGYGQPGGGGFGRGLMGGVLGGMAGGYLYDRMRGGGDAGAAPSDPNAAAGPQDAGAAGEGTFSDTPVEPMDPGGGDFGDADFGGGGDFGGGDAGGGDF